jgi:hypothetical protein
MDARLWGGLQNYVDLSMIYGKLPIEDFFRLRTVCKEWNRLASDQPFLEETFKDPIPPPYFLIETKKANNRMLTRDISQGWKWTRLPNAYTTAAGLLCSNFEEEWVFNVHTRVFHTLPPVPPLEDNAPVVEGTEENPEEDGDHPLIGITVDTSVSPYTFRLVFGFEDVRTRIYDSKSNSWTCTLSVCEDWRLGQHSFYAESDPTCALSDGVLHLRVWEMYGDFIIVHCYSPEQDYWTSSRTHYPHADQEELVTYDIGAWQDRLFLFGMKARPTRTIMAWEETKAKGNGWTLFDRMPDELWSWIRLGLEIADDDFNDFSVAEMQTRFCGEYVLVYICLGSEAVAERAVLYNLDLKTWERVEVPE